MKKVVIARKVKHLRMLNGVSQEELSEKTGLSLRTIQRIENCETEARGDSLKRIADFFEVSMTEVVCQTGEIKVLKIRRSESIWGCLKNYRVVIDDEKVGRIANGDIRQFEVEGKSHSVVVKLSRFVKSPNVIVDFTKSDVITLEASFSKYKLLSFVILALVYILNGLGLIFHLYHMTTLLRISIVFLTACVIVFGSKNFVKLKEV